MPETTYLGNEGSIGQEDRVENEELQETMEQNTIPAFQSIITNLQPETGILATAEVRIGDICTIRNVKVKENDSGIEVVMPRTKMPFHAGYKDACFFESREIREQFDQSVLCAYEQQMDPGHEMGQELIEDDMEWEEGEEPEMGM